MQKAILTNTMLRQIEAYCEKGYPEEIAGFLLGRSEEELTVIHQALPMENRREAEYRPRRYLITTDDWIRGENEASQHQLCLVGVFHSHPDHPSLPSQFDLDYALPNFLYLITCVRQEIARSTDIWQLKEDRTAFDQCQVLITT